MIKIHQTLEKLIKENHFDYASVATIDHHIMARHELTDKWYICHFEILEDGYSLSECKCYDRGVALLTFIKLVLELQDETR